MDQDMIEALDNADNAEELKKDAKTPAQAYEKIREAEKALDNVFHQVKIPKGDLCSVNWTSFILPNSWLGISWI